MHIDATISVKLHLRDEQTNERTDGQRDTHAH